MLISVHIERILIPIEVASAFLLRVWVNKTMQVAFFHFLKVSDTVGHEIYKNICLLPLENFSTRSIMNVNQKKVPFLIWSYFDSKSFNLSVSIQLVKGKTLDTRLSASLF